MNIECRVCKEYERKGIKSNFIDKATIFALDLVYKILAGFGTRPRFHLTYVGPPVNINNVSRITTHTCSGCNMRFWHIYTKYGDFPIRLSMRKPVVIILWVIRALLAAFSILLAIAVLAGILVRVVQILK